MQKYMNYGGNSNISKYEISADYIDVEFKDGAIYRYSYKSAGIEKIEQMKILARQGQGLNSYIMRHAKKNYEQIIKR